MPGTDPRTQYPSTKIHKEVSHLRRLGPVCRRRAGRPGADRPANSHDLQDRRVRDQPDLAVWKVGLRGDIGVPRRALQQVSRLRSRSNSDRQDWKKAGQEKDAGGNNAGGEVGRRVPCRVTPPMKNGPMKMARKIDREGEGEESAASSPPAKKTASPLASS